MPKFLVLRSPVRCSACLNRKAERPACTLCEGAGFISLSRFMEAASTAALQDITVEAQRLIRSRDLSNQHRAETFLTMEEAATLKGVDRRTIYNILNNEDRNAKIFPRAFFEGAGKNGVWRIPLSEVEAWQPRVHISRPPGEASALE